MNTSISKNFIEFFAGSAEISQVAKSKGMNTFTIDWKQYGKIDLVKDVEQVKLNDIPFTPDVIWASPDCTTYTIAAISTHRNGTEPKSDYAKKCDAVNKHFISLINEWLLINPKMVFFIENPRGMMRKMPFMKDFERVTIWYCRYGDNRAKPTDIWSNNIYSLYNQNGWKPKPRCFNGNKHCKHEEAPRGSKAGTQGRNGSYERSKIPIELCNDIFDTLF
jgi:site-specific DNA-cytosine methylase